MPSENCGRQRKVWQEAGVRFEASSWRTFWGMERKGGDCPRRAGFQVASGNLVETTTRAGFGHLLLNKSGAALLVKEVALFFETGTCYVAQAGLEFSPFSCLSLPRAGITGMDHHAWPAFLFF
jgi:hypothetical protein